MKTPLALLAVGLAAGAIAVPRAAATVELQQQARKLDFKVTNCLYCHASAHAVKLMRERARTLNMADGNCLLCHGERIPGALNERGQWLVDQRAARGAKAVDVTWLKDYVEKVPSEK